MEKLDSRVCNSVVAALLHTLDHLPRSQTATPLSWNCKLLGRSCVFKQCSRGWPLAGGVEPHHGTHDTPARYYNQQTFVRNASTTSDFVRSKLLRGDRPTFVELKRTVVLERTPTTPRRIVHMCLGLWTFISDGFSLQGWDYVLRLALYIVARLESYIPGYLRFLYI